MRLVLILESRAEFSENAGLSLSDDVAVGALAPASGYALAAVRITSITSLGLDSIGT